MGLICRIALGAMLSTLATASFADNKGITLEDKRQAACYDDVQRLCPNTIPDAAKAEACMKDKRSKVSKKCSDLWDAKS